MVAPPELHLFRFATLAECHREYPASIARLDALFRRLRLPGVGRNPDPRWSSLSPEEAYPLLAAAAPGRILIDKTPAYSRSPTALARIETLRPRYVWLIRNPLAVALSRAERLLSRRRDAARGIAGRLSYLLYRLRWEYRWRTGRLPRWESDNWTRAHPAFESAMSAVSTERKRTVHFEEFVRSPRATLTALADWFGTPFDEEMLDSAAHLAPGLRWGVGEPEDRHHAGHRPGLGGPLARAMRPEHPRSGHARDHGASRSPAGPARMTRSSGRPGAAARGAP